MQMPPLGRGRRALTLLIDPIFADRASPTDHAGPSRRLEPPCEIEHLPQIDLLFISHNQWALSLSLPSVWLLRCESGELTCVCLYSEFASATTTWTEIRSSRSSTGDAPPPSTSCR